MDRKKVALVTGASRGIGRAICLKLAKCGMDIAFTYNSDVEGAEETKALCEAQGAAVYMYQADVKSSAACADLVKDLISKTDKHIDVLVNNAGVTRDNLIMRIKDEDMDAVIDANLKGTFYMMREVSRIMLRQRSGKIVNISSVVGLMGNAGQVNYAATKAGVIGMTKSLARELASRHINVNAVAPGVIETKMTADLPEDVKAQLTSQILFKEAGKPEDIANAVAFLSGDESNYITGQVLCVDGGMAL